MSFKIKTQTDAEAIERVCEKDRHGAVHVCGRNGVHERTRVRLHVDACARETSTYLERCGLLGVRTSDGGVENVDADALVADVGVAGCGQGSVRAWSTICRRRSPRLVTESEVETRG